MPAWELVFIDYLYLSYMNATAFSPTDTLPLSHWAKLLMMARSRPRACCSRSLWSSPAP